MKQESCDFCDAGKISAVWAATECVSCPIGKNSEKGTSVCISCEAGKAGEECGVTCQAGQYAPVGSTACFTCPEGFVTNSSTLYARCSDCGFGQEGSGTGNGQCIQCGAGTSKKWYGAGSCISCELGTAASAGSFECDACAEGKYSASDGSECLDCAGGTVAATGSASCFTCPTGKFRDNTTSMAVCALCALGTPPPILARTTAIYATQGSIQTVKLAPQPVSNAPWGSMETALVRMTLMLRNLCRPRRRHV